MEISQTEVKLISKVDADRTEQVLTQLAEAQLALIGGGIGEVVLG